MAHKIAVDQITQSHSMMYTGEEPWHGLGTQLDKPATSAEALKAAHLDWEVAKKPLYLDAPNGQRIMSGAYAIIRTDYLERGIDQVFGIVSKEYEPLQNKDAFTFFDDIVGQDAAIYHTAGALGQGERIWILAKLPDDIQVIGEDICNKYLLLSNSHDGQSSVQMKFTPVRVVCQNTLTQALLQGPTIRVSHTRNIHERMEKAKELLGIINSHYESITENFQAMTRVKIDDEKLSLYYRLVFPDPRDPQDEIRRQLVERDRQIAGLYFREGHGNQAKGVAGTLWAAYNGVTEMVDYPNLVRNPESYLRTIWFGDGYLNKARAYRIAIENLKTWAA